MPPAREGVAPRSTGAAIAGWSQGPPESSCSRYSVRNVNKVRASIRRQVKWGVFVSACARQRRSAYGRRHATGRCEGAHGRQSPAALDSHSNPVAVIPGIVARGTGSRECPAVSRHSESRSLGAVGRLCGWCTRCRFDGHDIIHGDYQGGLLSRYSAVHTRQARGLLNRGRSR